MPFPNEHACRLRPPGDFQPDSFRRTSRESNGKTYHIIVGRKKGETSTTEQAYRYPKGSWTADAARAHCSGHEGASFEAASGATEKGDAGDVVLTGEFSKFDDEERIAFGWATIAKDVDGSIDHDGEGDILAFDVDALRKAWYGYVEKSGRSDDVHRKYGTGKIVEAMFFDPEKLEKLGLPGNALPTGAWVGIRILDNEVWRLVKAGERPMFSIRGKGRRIPIEEAAA